MDRSSARLAVPRALGAAVLLGGVLVALPLLTVDDRTPSPMGTAYAGTLKPFGSCDTVLQYFKDEAPEYLINWAGGYAMTDAAGGGVEPVSAGAAPQRDSGAESGGTPVHSTTNVQEAGVDEPDIVKTDGNRIVAVAQARVHLVGVSDGTMTLRRTLPDTDVRNVFLSGDRLLVFSGQAAETFEPGLRWAGQQAVLTMYDISDLGDPELVATLTVDGDVLDARLVGAQVRVATVSSPDVDAPSPTYTRTGRISATSKAELRAAIARTTVDDWVPTYTLRDGAGAPVSRGRLVECADLARPEKFSGLDTVAVTSFDMGSSLKSRQTVGVVAGGQQIYATDASTYVSTTDWNPEGFTAKTTLHKFVTAPSGASTYSGSGEVPGTLLNQYAMSEYQGVLRVASTVSERRGWANPRQVTEGMVTTLREQDGTLRQLGQVGGLGREDNESIHAVRFIEERGYVVTFRQTDPLYVLDLRDPAAPKVAGELKIPGYSGYLHPVGEDRLLGVGQSGQRAVQFSLFDISDPAAPRRIDTQTYGSGAAAAEFDPRAFLYWPQRDLVVAPMTSYDSSRGGEASSGLVLLRVDGHGLTELGRLTTTRANDTAQRSVVIDDTVYLLSGQALQANSLDTLRKIDDLVL